MWLSHIQLCPSILMSIEERLRRLEDSFLSLVQLNRLLADRCDQLERHLRDAGKGGEENLLRRNELGHKGVSDKHESDSFPTSS